MFLWTADLTRTSRTFNEERLIFLTNGTGTPGHPDTDEWSWTLTSDHIQKLTQIDQFPKLKSSNYKTHRRKYRN